MGNHAVREKILPFAAFAAIAAVAAILFMADSSAQTGQVRSLRGPADMEEAVAPPRFRSHRANGGRLERAYRQQPPLIPHKTEKYQIDLKVNQCLYCHDWPYNVDQGAPKISETHYTNRDGVALDHVARTRWFCTQCHVPQVDAPALVRNGFKSAFEVE